MNKENIECLVDILNRETELFNDILNVSKNKTKIIINGDVKGLEKIINLEQAMVLKIGKLEDEREKALTNISKDLEGKEEELNISNLLKKLPKETANELKECRFKIKEIIGEIKNTNVLNSKLIKDSLDFINFSVSLFSDSGVVSDNYDDIKGKDESKNASIFDIKL